MERDQNDPIPTADRRAAIARLIGQNPPPTQQQIADAVGLSRSRTTEIVGEMSVAESPKLLNHGGKREGQGAYRQVEGKGSNKADYITARLKRALGHGHWLAMFQNKEVPFDESTARRLMIIADDDRLSNRAHAHDLPQSWYTLYELTKLDDATFDAALASGAIRPDQASYLRGKRYNGEKQAQGGTGANQHVQKDQNDLSATADRLASEYKVSAPTITRDGQYAAAIDTLKHAGIDPHKVIAHEPKAAVVEFAKAIAPKPEPPAVPLLPPEPTKQKDPDTAETNVRYDVPHLLRRPGIGGNRYT